MRNEFVMLGLAAISFALPGCQERPDCADCVDGADGADGAVLPPTDTELSFAVTNNSGEDHEGVDVVALDFDSTAPDATTVVSNKTQNPPSIDGVDEGASEWGGHESVVVFNEGTAILGTESATLRSLYTDDHIYFFAQWRETSAEGRPVSPSTARYTYTFDGSTWSRSEDEDRAIFIFPIDDADFADQGCRAACHPFTMRTRDGEKWEVWQWMAARNGPSQSLDDRWWNDGDGEEDGRQRDQGLSSYWEPGSSTEPAWKPGAYTPGSGHPFEGPVWAWEVVPFDASSGWVAGDGFPGSIARLPTGSRADVTAVGKWDGTDTWTLEIKRARRTGNADDRQF